MFSLDFRLTWMSAIRKLDPNGRRRTTRDASIDGLPVTGPRWIVKRRVTLSVRLRTERTSTLLSLATIRSGYLFLAVPISLPTEHDIQHC